MPTYLVVIGKTTTGYSAHCPDVLGCAAAGKTLAKVMSNMKEALEFHFEGMLEDGTAIPKPGGVASYREALRELDLDQYFMAHVRVEPDRFAAPASQPRRKRIAE